MPHNYMYAPAFGTVLDGKFLSKNSGPELGTAIVEFFGREQPASTVLPTWIKAHADAGLDWKTHFRAVWCTVPDKYTTVHTLAATRVRTHEHDLTLFLSDEDEKLENGDIGIYILFEKRESQWFAAILGIGAWSDVRPTVVPLSCPAVALESLVSNGECGNLTLLERQRFTRTLPLAKPLLPAPTTEQVSVEDMDELVKRFVSFCIRWHCVRHTRVPERRSDQENLLRQHLYSRTLKFFKTTTAREMLANPLLHMVVSVVQRLSKSNKLRAFTRQQLISAVEFVCGHEISTHNPAIQATFVRDFMHTLAESTFAAATDGTDRDIALLDLRIDADGRLSYALCALSAELDDLLFPTEEQLSVAGSGVDIDEGRVFLSSTAALSLVPHILRRYYQRIRPRFGKATVQLARSLEAFGFSYDLDQYDAYLPYSSQFYADTRPNDLDDVALHTPDCRGLRLHSFSAPEANGLSRSLEELRSGLECQHTVTTSTGRIPVPRSALFAIEHVAEEARLRIRTNQLSSSSLRKSQSLTNHSSVDECEYAADPDGSIYRDNGFREWFRLHHSHSSRSAVRQRVEVEYEEAEASVSVSSSSQSVPSARNPGEIEDLLENVYRNRGMPLCVLGFARDIVDLGESPKDLSRITYYPFLRSLELPNVSSRGTLAHMMRSVDPKRFDEFYHRFSQTGPKNCASSKAKSKARFIAKGSSEDDAERMSLCFPRCASKQMNGSCPFSHCFTAEAKSDLRRLMITAGGLGMNSVEAVMHHVENGRASAACKQFFVETRPTFGAKTSFERVPPFPPGREFWINHPREFVYLAAIHMEASLRQPPGYGPEWGV